MRFLPLVQIVLLIGSCTTVENAPPAATIAGPDAIVPRFSADDPRVQTAGFVGKTLRLNQEVDETTYTLMAFIVGDTATLGAMVKGSFQGEIRWCIGTSTMTFEMDTEASLSGIEVTVEGPPLGNATVGEGASFRGISWINVDLPAEALGEGTPLQLTFHPQASDTPIVLPQENTYYVTRVDDL
ncbi:MAG: hypothetical protein AAGG01_00020 [Planctomycetota bacterium]